MRSATFGPTPAGENAETAQLIRLGLKELAK
jgi:hypothetical protein